MFCGKLLRRSSQPLFKIILWYRSLHFSTPGIWIAENIMTQLYLSKQFKVMEVLKPPQKATCQVAFQYDDVRCLPHLFYRKLFERHVSPVRYQMRDSVSLHLSLGWLFDEWYFHDCFQSRNKRTIDNFKCPRCRVSSANDWNFTHVCMYNCTWWIYLSYYYTNFRSASIIRVKFRSI